MMRVNPFGERKRGEWETPPELFEVLNREFKFSLDVCATSRNTKCDRFFTKEDDGLTQSWKGERCWLNPPYYEIPKWLEKASKETEDPDTLVVALLPVSIETRWFKRYCKDREVRFLPKRVAFLDENKVPNKGNPRPSMIVIFQKGRAPKMFLWEIEW